MRAPVRSGVRVRSTGVARPAAAAAWLALALFALIGIGGPLVGIGVFAATDAVVQSSPYYDAGLAGGVQTLSLNDTYDTFLPNTLLFADAFRSGEFASWNPYILGGVPLGATPNFAVASPLTWPFLVLPGWLAPAWMKLAEIAVAVTGCVLFARRIGLGRPAALAGGLVFASSAFLVVWTNWPQTRTAAIIGFVFWAAERLVQRGRAVDAVALALAVAAMLAGGFPAVTGYTLFFAGLYLLVRVFAEHRSGRWGLRVVLTAAAGVMAGAALMAVQLVPFAATLSGSLVDGREQTPQDSIAPEALLTTIAPNALGTLSPDGIPAFGLTSGFIEAQSFVGAAALLLAVVAVTSVRRGRVLLPSGAWGFLVGATALMGVAAYAGGPVLAALQQLPFLFSDNDVGRVRSVLGFLVAVLAAVGAEVVLRGRGSPVAGRREVAYAVTVWLAVVVGVAALWSAGRGLAAAVEAEAGDGLGRVAALDRSVWFAVLLVALAAAAAAVLRWAPAGRGVRTGAAVLLPLLIVVQALDLVVGYWPRSDRETFFPVTDVQRFLAAELDGERYAHSLNGMGTGADAPHRLRALNGHIFVDRRFAELVDELPGRQFGNPPTLPVLGPGSDVVTSPVLDRLGVRYYVNSPAEPVIGYQRGENPGSPSASVRLRPDRPVTVALDGDETLRAVGVTPRAVPDTADGAEPLRIEVVLRDELGREISRGVRAERGMAVGRVFEVPVAEVPAGAELTAEIVVRGSADVLVHGAGTTPEVTTVRSLDDGLRLAHAGSSTVYERATALPRIRWASGAVVEPDPAARVALLATGAVPAGLVVLDEPGPAGPTGSAEVRVRTDGFDEIEVEVVGDGAGYLVVADALQNGWSARVDGEPAPLRPADHGVVAVAVPAGTHTVSLSYDAAGGGPGAWISAVTALVLLGTLLTGRYSRRTPIGRSR